MRINFDKVEYIYQKNSPVAERALYNIDLSIPSQQFIAIVGQTGSGKSSLLQLLNGLLIPTSGTVQIGDATVHSDKKNKQLKDIRKKVGMVFQFPEQQLFEETVEKDICFGPMNFGVPLESAKERAKTWIEQVGLADTLLEVSPFELSGGQMRRVAIAGVLAMEPEVLVLDEPTVGLDPSGSNEIMQMIVELHRNQQMTTILVTHQMDLAARYADQIIIMNNGTVAKMGKPDSIFSEANNLNKYGLELPLIAQFQNNLEEKIGQKLSKKYFVIDELINEVCLMIKGSKNVR